MCQNVSLSFNFQRNTWHLWGSKCKEHEGHLRWNAERTKFPKTVLAPPSEKCLHAAVLNMSNGTPRVLSTSCWVSFFEACSIWCLKNPFVNPPPHPPLLIDTSWQSDSIYVPLWTMASVMQTICPFRHSLSTNWCSLVNFHTGRKKGFLP